MARLLITAVGFPDDLTSGRHLRVHHLCRSLAREHELYLVDLSGATAPRREDGLEPFQACEVLNGFPAVARSWRRHLRRDNASLLRLSYPDYFERTLARVRELARAWRIDCVISCAPGRAEIASSLELPRLIDLTDSLTLTTERILANRGREMPLAERLLLRANLPRQRAGERAVVRAFDYTLSISRSDRQRLLELSGVPPERIVLVPNGVAPEALAAWQDRPSQRRRVLFWGNLDFPPNWTAVRYFHDRIYLPFLAPAGVEWEILGRHADETIRAMADHPLIHLGGFKPDLFAYVAGGGVMANPMVEGSGLKNKVLEAFAVGLPVISTPLGVDALQLESGRECMIADDPRGFADAVLQLLDEPALYGRVRASARRRVEHEFSWEHIGDSVSRLIEQLLQDRGTGAGRARPAV